jgi:hypothetical protein
MPPGSVGIGPANATQEPCCEPRKHDTNYPVCISSYFSLGDAHCTALYIFLSIFINELVHQLVLLLFYARFLLILASTALRRIQFLLLLFQVYLFAFPQSFGTRKTEVRHLNTCLLSTYLRVT